MLGVPLPGAARWLKPQSERRSISPIIVNDSLAQIAPQAVGLRFTAAAEAAGLERRVTAHSGRVGLARALSD